MDPVIERLRLRKALLVVFGVVCLGVLFHAPGSVAFLPFGAGVDKAAEPVESYALPITPPLDQGNSALCWVYAALSMLETNYLARHPGSHIELSRAALQVNSVEDRFARLISGEAGKVGDGGLAVEALALIRQNGAVARRDFHDIVDPAPIVPSIREKLSQAPSLEEKRKLLETEIGSTFGETPDVTHLDGETLSPQELAKAALGSNEWAEFDRARDGAEGIGPSHDPDARPETRVVYVNLDRLIDLIHRSLADGRSVVGGTADHAFLIYGADYDRDGKPISYLIKDSLAPFLYRESAEDLHEKLTDVTVALSAGSTPSGVTFDKPRARLVADQNG